MKKKSFFIGAALLCAAAAPAFCGIGELMTAAKYNEFDAPLIDGITYFMSATANFARMAKTLATVLGVVCVVWNAFKLWMGTEQVRKACADIITKFLIFIAAFNLYPSVVKGTIDLAVNVGSTAGRGTQDILTEFSTLYLSCKQKVDAAQSMIDRFIKDGHYSNVVLTDKTIQQLADAAGTGAAGMNIDARIAQQEPPAINDNDGWVNGQYVGNGAETGGDAMTRNQARAEEAQRRAAEIIKQYKEGGVEQAMTILNAMAEVFSLKITKRGGLDPIVEGFYDPFIKNEKGKYSYLISPGSMIKTAVVIAQVISTKESTYYEEQEAAGEKSGSFIEKAISNTVQSVLHSVLVMLMTFGVIASAVFFTIQYVMCVFEYFIVSAVGVIFIPFCLWDGTKSFTAKLVTLFSAYFIKLLVMMFCIFWVFSAYLRMGNHIISDANGITLLNFAYFLFTALLGWVVTQNAPQVALAMLNGSPQLSMGEFMHAAGTAAAAGLAAGKAGQWAGKTAAAGVQKGGRAAQTGAAAAAGAISEGKAAAEYTGSTSAGVAAGAGALFSTMGAGIKNSAVQLLTGKETEDRKKGFGSGATGKDGKPIAFAEQMRRAAGGEGEGEGGGEERFLKKQIDKEKRQAEKAAKRPPESEGAAGGSSGGSPGGKPDGEKPLVIK
jgi:type IV secretion system protein TrbL